MAPSEPELLTLTNEDERFYPLLGPFLARREVHKALGGPPFDDDAKTWTVALAPEGTAIGFVGVTRTGALESLYAVPSERDTLYPLLVRAAVRAAGDRALHATVTRERTDAYLSAGFAITAQLVNFDKLARPRGTTP
ncbi:hypothetical protein ACFC58_07095 [Kitasatospora purpeofusca]|uniref:hypothetical protein n=1 Tax=Kitasatospora purpeofusca TaxID=67352 RepID=UPI0035DE81D9